MEKTHDTGDATGRIRELEDQLAREIAAREVLDEALRRSQAQFRMMAANPSEMVLAYDMQRRLTFANAAALALTGYSEAEIGEARFINWIHEEDRARMMGYWDGLFEGRGFKEEEYRLIARDGRVRWMSAAWGPILDESGRQVGVEGREREVTERHMERETLRLGEQRYRNLFEDSPFPMWEEDFSAVKVYLDGLTAAGVADLRGHLTTHRADAEECVRRIRVLDVNRAARQFYGATREELMGDLSRIFDDAAYQVICDELAELAAGNQTYKTEFETHTASGVARTVNMIVSLETPAADWSRAIVSFFDITDRKQLEEELLHSQKLESLGRLAGGVAHDFNNLLMVITGYSDLLLGGGELPEGTRSGLSEIRRASERGAELTQQLLAFSRKQNGLPRVMDLNLLIRESAAVLEAAMGTRIELVIRLEEGAWNIRADSGQMHQVLMNLATNAREAMPQGGVLTIATRNATDAEGEHLLLEVRDTGRGMDATTRLHLFEPFFPTRLGSTAAGLGLATVFGLVTQAGGHLKVSSEPEQGATFSVYFPRANEPVQPAAGPAKKIAGSEENGTVMVVEDQVEVRRLASRILSEMGFRVLEAADGAQALSAAEHFRGKIRLMLTDVIMPEMNGKELAERMARQRPETRVIYMSGYTDRILGANGVLEGTPFYIQKPFRAEELSAIIRRALG
jgi:two-component system, cell cycle sensor histidine kinase and response regulator CckA